MNTSKPRLGSCCDYNELGLCGGPIDWRFEIHSPIPCLLNDKPWILLYFPFLCLFIHPHIVHNKFPMSFGFMLVNKPRRGKKKPMI